MGPPLHEPASTTAGPAVNGDRRRRSCELAIVLSLETVDDMVVRGFARPPDRLIRSVVADPRIERLLVVGPFRTRLGQWLRRLTVHRGAAPPLDVHFDTLQPFRLARRDPTSSEALGRTYRRYDRMVARALERRGFDSPAAIDFNPLHAGFGPGGWARSLTYYARDDWAAHPIYRRWWPALGEARERLRERSCAVAAVSQVLLERLAPTGPAMVLPNGIDEAEWTAPGDPPRWFADLPRPRFLYLGTLDDRLDVDGLASLARRYPHGSVVLVGPLMPDSPVGSLDAANVHLVGHRDRSTVVALTAHSDVCLLVHRRTPLTEAMSPLKLYEYLAGGCPVLATDLAPVRGISDRVVAYCDPGDILVAADRALAVGRASEEERLAFVRDNSWRRRHDQLLDFAFSHGH